MSVPRRRIRRRKTSKRKERRRKTRKVLVFVGFEALHEVDIWILVYMGTNGTLIE
jgi:hypothetical protein